jgi:Bacteriophage probable baseplate hub protein
MATLTSMADASVAARGFYVPQFEVRIENAGLPRDVLRDVVEVTYKDKIDEIDSCEITVNNWDASRRAFKYIGAEDLDENGQPNDPSDPAAANWKIFDPCGKKVELHLGYAGQLEQMMIGNFVTLEPNFPASGPPTLAVRILNRLHKLRSAKYDYQWQDMRDSEIAEDIAQRRDPKRNNAKRFPIPIETDPEAKAKEPKLEVVGQRNQYDVDFLWQRARINGYVVVIREENGEEKLYFGPSKDPTEPVTYQLEWGQSLIDFKPTITTANQYKSVTVRGWDRAAQKTIEEKVDFQDPDLAKLNRDLHHLVEQCDPREEDVVEVAVFTKDEARKKALAIMAEQAKRMVRASGTTVGLPKLRAGCKIELGDSVGSRLRGTYFVTATQHIFNNNGYTTKFEARREDERTGGGK